MDDPAAFDELFDRHAPAIFRFAAHRLGRQAAEDVLAETFTRAYAARVRACAVDGSLRAWLYRIAANLIADELRRRRRASAAGERLRAREGVQFAADEGVAAVDPELLAALETLREQEREVLLLFAWGELSYAEIAVVTGDPIGTVRSRLSRARSHLRAVLDASASEVA